VPFRLCCIHCLPKAFQHACRGHSQTCSSTQPAVTHCCCLICAAAPLLTCVPWNANVAPVSKHAFVSGLSAACTAYACQSSSAAGALDRHDPASCAYRSRSLVTVVPSHLREGHMVHNAERHLGCAAAVCTLHKSSIRVLSATPWQ
jgi:hypothetical protein